MSFSSLAIDTSPLRYIPTAFSLLQLAANAPNRRTF
jgi:hypothetical protein